MFGARIREHAAWVAEMLDAYPDIARIEARTKSSLIEPLLRCLGYEPNDPGQVELEAVIRGKKVDYMLTGEKNAKVAVEAKPAKTTLSGKEMDQLDTYFHHSEAVAGVLTNGVVCWLFTDLEKTNVMDSEPYRKINITQLSDNDIHHLETLTRGHVSQSGVREQAQRERHRNLVNRIVTQELKSPSQEFLRVIGKKAGIKPLTKPNLRILEPLVNEAIHLHLGVESAFQPEPSSSPSDESYESPQTHSSPPTSGSSPDPEPFGAGKKAHLTRSRFKGATLFGQKLSAESYRQMLTSLVAELQTRHPNDFGERVGKEPFVKGTRKWQYISRDKSDFYPPAAKHEVGGYWVDTHLDRADTVKRAHLFLREFGHDPNELVIYTSE